jgi:peroxiredoxin Q/BCP
MNARAVVPDFELPATGNQRFQFSAFKGHPFALYSYPRDMTPGCTTEDAEFRAKTMYGRPVRGIGRSTFVIDRGGRSAREWRGVIVPGHARQVLEYARTARL